MVKKRLKELQKGNGFFLLKLKKIDLELIRKIVNEHFLKSINSKYPNLNKNLSINKYHKISSKIDHKIMWPVKSRVLPKNMYKNFIKLSFIDNLKKIFGKFNISDENKFGHGEIIWRIVRPNENNDVGPIHCDKWFWDLNPNHYTPRDCQRIKCWISLWCKGKNGLQISPGSQLKNFKYKSKFKHGYMKPIFDIRNISLNLEKQNCVPGTVIIFNDNLLHGGVTNKSLETRVSIEFTMFVKKKNF